MDLLYLKNPSHIYKKVTKIPNDERIENQTK